MSPMFAKKIQKLMADSNLSFEQLGAIANVSRSTANDWVNKGTMPRLDEAFRLARHFEVTLEYLANDAVPEAEQDCSKEDKYIWDTVEELGREEAKRRLLSVHGPRISRVTVSGRDSNG